MASPSKQFICQTPPAEIVRHFQSTPWALALFSDPTLRPFTMESRIAKLTSTTDTFMARTLATDDTIIAWQAFHKISHPVPRASATSPPSSKAETVTVLKIGSGLNGHVDICHGGVVSSIFDEVLGVAAISARPKDESIMTAYLKVDYKEPVRTPGVLLCRAWVEKSEGRKTLGRATMENGLGVVLATGEALFVVVERDKVNGKL